MIPQANGLHGRSLRIGAMLFLALSFCPCFWSDAAGSKCAIV